MASTLLAVGVVSRNTVDAAIAAAYETDSRLMLIASRRQVDYRSSYGYVEGWSSPELSGYVRERDPESRLLIGRDHGGPWQHPNDLDPMLDERAAMDRALDCLKMDIDAGFDILHLDTSVAPDGPASLVDAARRLLELYGQAVDYAVQVGRTNFDFEVGLEDQRIETHRPSDLAASLEFIFAKLEQRSLPKPRYVVVQTGTKVVGMQNVGVINQPAHRDLVGKQLLALVELCESYGVGIKAHNCDYLDKDAWDLISSSGIAGVNIAPEYGVTETHALLQIMQRYGERRLLDDFLRIAHQSGKWRRWMTEDHPGTDLDRSIVAGHYVFSTPEARMIYCSFAQRHGVSVSDLHRVLSNAVKSRILWHLGNLSPTRSVRSANA